MSRKWALLFCVTACGLFVGAAQAHAQAWDGASPMQLPLLRLGLGFLICTLLAIAAAFALRRLTKGRAIGGPGWLRGAGHIVVAESRRMSMHADVCRIICADREYLVIVSTSGATVLRESPASASTAEQPP